MNYFDLGPQNSRGFRALKIWLALQHAGAEAYRQMIGEDIPLARHLYELAAEHPELEAITHNLSITTLRYVPLELRASVGSEQTEAYLNRLNQLLLTDFENSGRGVLFQCFDRREVRLAVLHRQFPNLNRGHRGDTAIGGTPGPPGSLGAYAVSDCGSLPQLNDQRTQMQPLDSVTIKDLLDRLERLRPETWRHLGKDERSSNGMPPERFVRTRNGREDCKRGHYVSSIER